MLLSERCLDANHHCPSCHCEADLMQFGNHGQFWLLLRHERYSRMPAPLLLD